MRLLLVLLVLTHPGTPMARLVPPHLNRPAPSYGGGAKRTVKKVSTVTVPMPTGINIHYGPIPAAAGPLAGGYSDGNDIYLPRHPDAWSRAHEYGHMLDAVISDKERQRFERLIGARGPWVQSDGTVENSYGSPHEWFADYYAAVATGYDPRKQFQESYATIRPRRLKRVRRELERLAARRPDLIQYR